MLRLRVLTAIVLLAGLLSALLLLPAMGWLLLCAAICGAAAWEWGGLASFGRGARSILAPVFALACLALGYSAGLAGDRLPPPSYLGPIYLVSAAFWLGVIPAWLALKWKLDSAALAVAVGAVVLLPPALALAHLRLIDPRVLLAAMAAVWVADIAAYFSGRAFGRHKLAPGISPGKTWEGAAGAAIGVLVFGIVLSSALNIPPPAGWAGFAVLLIVYTGISIVGDLFESLLKRQAGLKDSGTLLPGHGGILDRIDSLTSTLPIAGLAALWWAR
ncbi:phosphatidate cytidylyltransferase [Thauera sinica]|uniref:Phosphatidate cytidylyltransferase n=1 Tax=Thauera sinica TaxID=2665146 RepID=A0ABW1ATS3_9RHOO|nr:phosphatidate cytidylyltransferase [Thauera sp. K11]ATE59994.1 phosphatidate cytidylyltransferase [Thauera sp. K11]